MKKVFLSLALVAAFTVVSCKQTEEKTEETTVTEEVAPVEEVAPATADTMSVETETTTTTATEEAPAAAPAQ
ncbi:MAG TPA: hypothetical protein VFQ50_01975 [Flavobacterium sp.]|jgi:uncharacterized protein YcfL|nr:hypothetical protein [Flavobacterium sp.]